MANAQQGNLIYIDTTANDIDTASTKVFYAILTPTSANGSVVLLAASGGSEIIRFQDATANEAVHYDFSLNPVILSKGVHATVSNAKLTLVTKKVGGN